MSAYISDGTLMTALDALEKLLGENRATLKRYEAGDEWESYYYENVVPIEVAIKECYRGLTGAGQ